MSKKLSQILFYLGIICVAVLLFEDALFFWYVQTFHIAPYSLYLDIYYLVENSVPILLLPACYSLFHLLKLFGKSFKIRLVLYLLCVSLLPFAFFHAFEAKLGQLSYDYTSPTAIIVHRFYFKLMLTTFVIFFVFIPIGDVIAMIQNKNKPAGLKQLGQTTGLCIGALILIFTSIGVVEGQLFSLLNRLMLVNKVETTIPKLPQFTNQHIIITDYPKPAIDCYLKQNPSDISAKILNLIAGTYYFKELGYNTYYLNDHCFVVYLGAPLMLSRDRDSTSMIRLSELLIRQTYGKWIRVNANKQPATIIIKGEESFTEGSERGQYHTETNTIDLQQGYDKVLETTTHELIHSFATDHFSPLGDFGSGLAEAITQYLNAKIMKNIAGSYKLWIYKDEVRAFETLLKYVDEGTVLDLYFNGDLETLQKPVDSKTYPGAYCRFTSYLDRSLLEYNKTQNYKLAEEYADKAIQALETKESDGLGCL